MKKLPLGLRLFLNVLVFSIPVLVLTYLMYYSETVNIEFGEKEKIGNTLQKPYVQLMQTLALTKLSTLLNESSVANKRLDEDFITLSKTMQQNGEVLQFTTEGLSSRKRQDASINNLAELIKQKKWDEAIVSIKMAITHLGDTSNLILDPDLDSYYLMDITLLALPQMQDRIQTILADRSKFFTGERITGPSRIQAAIYASTLNEFDFQRIAGDSQTSLNEDKNFYGLSESLQKNLPPAIADLKAKSDLLVQLLNKLAQAEPVDEKEFTQAGLNLLSGTYTTWFSFAQELDQLFDMRIQSLSSHRSRSLGMAGLALLFAILFSVIVGISFSQSIQGILASVRDLKKTSATSFKIGSHLSNLSKNVAESATSQAAAIEETAASVEEINSMVNTTASNSKEASNLALLTNKAALAGDSEINQMLASMIEISKSSSKIVETISVIDDIAFQTNLLALNASVEAARAGEQGKGFAVVADAVRSLAQKSALAAKEINDLVKNNVSVIEQGKKAATQSSVSLKNIIENISKLTTLLNEIAGATAEQSTGINQISLAITSIENGALKNQQGISTVNDSSQSLMHTSEELRLIVTTLEREVLGSNKTNLNIGDVQ